MARITVSVEKEKEEELQLTKIEAGSLSFPDMKDKAIEMNAILLNKANVSILDVEQLELNLQRLDRCSRLVKTYLTFTAEDNSELEEQKEQIRKLVSIVMSTLNNLIAPCTDNYLLAMYQDCLMKCSTIIKLWMTDEIEATTNNAATQAEFQKSLARKV